jgi:ectoine hydroxylase-related dioxygenase (phytanoyl-CoA dioxygenase family)
MNNRFAFLDMVVANDLLADPEALREQFDREGYLYFRQVLDRDAVKAVRRDILAVLADAGWTEGGFPPSGRCVTVPLREDDPAFLEVYRQVQRIESLHALAHHRTMTEITRAVLGDTAFPHPLKIARLNFPDSYETSTPPHQDYPNNQGTPLLTAAWVPMCDMTDGLGGLAVLRGSHKWGLLPVAGHMGAGNRCAVVPPDMAEECRWVTTDFMMGDVLLFPSLTVHAALHNASEFDMRLSVDFRYQSEGEELTPGCLEPHFGLLTWEEVYAGWESDEFQYYWKDLDYQLVPFRNIPVVEAGDSDELGRGEWGEIFRYVLKRDARVARRFEKLGIEGFEPTDVAGLLRGEA